MKMSMMSQVVVGSVVWAREETPAVFAMCHLFANIRHKLYHYTWDSLGNDY